MDGLNISLLSFSFYTVDNNYPYSKLTKFYEINYKRNRDLQIKDKIYLKYLHHDSTKLKKN